MFVDVSINEFNYDQNIDTYMLAFARETDEVYEAEHRDPVVALNLHLSTLLSRWYEVSDKQANDYYTVKDARLFQAETVFPSTSPILRF